MPENEKIAAGLKNGGNTRVLNDQFGRPSEMVYIRKFRWPDLFEGGRDSVCPAFIVEGREVDGIYISKYQNYVENGCAYSQKGRTPATNLTIDEARIFCSSKGKGWHLVSNAEWFAVACWCRKQAISASRAETEQMPEGFAVTGKGWEFVAGLRLFNGEIQMIPNNDSAANVDESRTSSRWRAVSRDGELIYPGKQETFCLDGVGEGNTRQDVHEIGGGAVLAGSVRRPQFTKGPSDRDFGCTCILQKELKAESEICVPDLIRMAGVGISGNASERDDILYVRNYGERIAIRGGNWELADGAGPFALYLSHSREVCSQANGFRAAFCRL